MILCRFCLDDKSTVKNPFLCPCLCKGSGGVVHLACLQKWFTFGGPEAKIKCPVCLSHYTFPPKEDRLFVNDGFIWMRFSLSLYLVNGILFIGVMMGQPRFVELYILLCENPFHTISVTSFFIVLFYAHLISFIREKRLYLREWIRPHCFLAVAAHWTLICFLPQIGFSGGFMYLWIFQHYLNEHNRIVDILNENIVPFGRNS